MKKFNLIIIGVGLFIFGCTESYIDDIIAVDPGPDMEAPVIVLNYPVEGTLIRVTEQVTSITVNAVVTDDIELESVIFNLNGTDIATFDEFRDFRRAVLEFPVDNITNGEHVLTVTANDLSGKTTTKSVNFEKVAPYEPVYDGEIFYLPFDGDNMELVSIRNATRVGNPGFAGTSVQGSNAFAGAADSYLTFPTEGLLHEEFSAVFWYKINNAPDRAGILTIGPPDPARPNNMNNRTQGFRFFREGSPTNQTFKLNVGNGSADNWFDGGGAASINPTVNTDWIHLAFTISGSSVAVYINGQVVSQGSFPGIGWADCDILSIASGAPRFTEWGHLSDRSFFDELRLFNKALSQQEIQTIINAEMP
jgi:hypothetical protein